MNLGMYIKKLEDDHQSNERERNCEEIPKKNKVTDWQREGWRGMR